MFLERCGKFFFQQMRPHFFFILAAFPPLLAVIFLFFLNGSLKELEDRFAAAARKGKIAMERKAKKERFLYRYSNTDPYFLDQQIETLVFNQKEQDYLGSLLNHPAFPHKESLRDRLSFLLSSENKIVFTEENIRTSSHIKETDEKQKHPVQLDESDLQKLLSLIEDIPIGPYLPLKQSPQLLIREFKLNRQETSFQNAILEIEMDLLKREFIKQ